MDVTVEPRRQPLFSLLLSLLAGRELTWRGCWFGECSENTAALGFPNSEAHTGGLMGTLTSRGLSSILDGLWATMATEQSPLGLPSCSPPPSSPAPGSSWPLTPCQGFPSPSLFDTQREDLRQQKLVSDLG